MYRERDAKDAALVGGPGTWQSATLPRRPVVCCIRCQSCCMLAVEFGRAPRCHVVPLYVAFAASRVVCLRSNVVFAAVSAARVGAASGGDHLLRGPHKLAPVPRVPLPHSDPPEPACSRSPVAFSAALLVRCSGLVCLLLFPARQRVRAFTPSFCTAGVIRLCCSRTARLCTCAACHLACVA
jgi:hypothetical protein